jgi:hypothetical protein
MILFGIQSGIKTVFQLKKEATVIVWNNGYELNRKA